MKPPNLKFSLEDVIDAFSYGVRLGESEPGCPTSRPATKHDVEKAKQEIMSAVTDQLAALETELNTIGAGVDSVVESSASISTSLSGIGADVTSLKTLIEQLQNSQGNTWTVEDQGILDRATSIVNALKSKTQAVSDQAKALSDQAKALDDQTPEPTPEPTPA